MIPSFRTLAIFTATAACAAQSAHAVSSPGSTLDHTPACCPAPTTAVDQAALSDKSIYQLDATWNDDNGKPMKLAAFKGHPVVIAMFYTQCRYACPMIVAAMQQIQAALPAANRQEVRFLLVSFDPDHDTSTTLHAYRREMRLADESWTLVHGDSEAVRELAMVLGVKYQKLDQGQYAHSNLITVLNSRGEIACQRTGLQGDDGPVLAVIEQGGK